MHCLCWAYADQDSQHLHTGGPLRHGRVKAVASLFDRGKVESRSIRDRLKEIGILCIFIGSGNCRMLPVRQGWYGLRELEIGIQVRVMGAAAVASPPTRVQRELRQICES